MIEAQDVADVEKTSFGGKEWTDEDNEFLLANYRHMTYRAIGEARGHKYGGVRTQARLMGLKKSVKINSAITVQNWTDQENEFLENNYRLMTHAEMSKELNDKSVIVHRTPDAVRNQCRFLGLFKQSRSKDKEKDKANKAFMRANYKEMTHQEMAEHLGIKKFDVSRYCTRYNLRKEKAWNDEDDLKITKMREMKMSVREIAVFFPERTESSIQQRFQTLAAKSKQTKPKSKKAA